MSYTFHQVSNSTTARTTFEIQRSLNQFNLELTPEYKARVIWVEDTGDFVVSFMVQNKDERSQFKVGTTMKAALRMQRHPIPTQRRLLAISRVCRPVGAKNKKRSRHLALQSFLLGTGIPKQQNGPGLIEESMKDMSPFERDRFKKYVSTFEVRNGPQKATWRYMFENRNFVTQLQGPPGTGKTKTAAMIAMTFMASNTKTAFCAPSNTAAEQCMEEVIKELNTLKKIDPKLSDSYTVVYLPTTAITKESLKNAGITEEHLANDIDEVASATEQDCLVPLSLGPNFNVIVGDHEQLKPTVRSRGYNKFAKQLGLPLYTRFYGHYNVPLHRLKINYRMHPDIAELPDMLTYKWLGCHSCTRVESVAYKLYIDWYNSEDGEPYRKGIRNPAWSGKTDEGNRVRWINPKGSKGAPAPGEHFLRNFANINAAVDLVTSMLNHIPGEGVEDINGGVITILSPYKADLVEMKRQLEMSIQGIMPEFLRIPEGTTVDKIQGGQNQIIIFLIPPRHPSSLGFMKE